MGTGTPPERSRHLGSLLQEYRAGQALSITKAAAQAGVDRHSWSDWEHGRRHPSPELIRNLNGPRNDQDGPLAKALKISWKKLAQAVQDDLHDWNGNGGNGVVLLLTLLGGWGLNEIREAYCHMGMWYCHFYPHVDLDAIGGVFW